jgi:hypothetical protein
MADVSLRLLAGESKLLTTVMLAFRCYLVVSYVTKNDALVGTVCRHIISNSKRIVY